MKSSECWGTRTNSCLNSRKKQNLAGRHSSPVQIMVDSGVSHHLGGQGEIIWSLNEMPKANRGTGRHDGTAENTTHKDYLQILLHRCPSGIQEEVRGKNMWSGSLPQWDMRVGNWLQLQERHMASAQPGYLLTGQGEKPRILWQHYKHTVGDLSNNKTQTQLRICLDWLRSICVSPHGLTEVKSQVLGIGCVWWERTEYRWIYCNQKFIVIIYMSVLK